MPNTQNPETMEVVKRGNKLHAPDCRHRGDASERLTVPVAELLYASPKDVADCAHTKAWGIENTHRSMAK